MAGAIRRAGSPANSGWRSGKLLRAAMRTDPHGGLVLLGQRDDFIPGIIACDDAPTTITGRCAASRSAATARANSAGSPPTRR